MSVSKACHLFCCVFSLSMKPSHSFSVKGNWHPALKRFNNQKLVSTKLTFLLVLKLSAMPIPPTTALTGVLVFQSSITHFNNFPVTGQREQHGHKSKVSWEAPLTRAPPRRCIAAGFEMQRRRGMCLHDDIVFIHQKLNVGERRCRSAVCRWRMTEHSAEPGWHANLTAASRRWWRATHCHIFLQPATQHSFTHTYNQNYPIQDG